MIFLNQVLEIILLLSIVGTTLAFGGVQSSAATAVEIVLFLCILILLIVQTRRGQIKLPLPIWPLLFVLWAVLQMVPLPWNAVVILSPARRLDTAVAGLWHHGQISASLSIYPHDTLLAFMKFLACLCAFVLAAYLFDSRKRKSNLIRGLILLACFEAGYGIFQYVTGLQKIFTYTKLYDMEEATGTYINRNHFAGLLEMALPFVVAIAFYHFQIWSERRQVEGGRRRSRETRSMGFQIFFYFFLLVILLVAVVFSRSRMGTFSAVLTIGIVAVLAQLKAKRRLWLVAVILFLACVAGYGLWIGLGPVWERFETIKEPGFLQMEGRFTIWKDTIRLIKDYPLVGTGLGTFASAYRHYQTGSVDLYVDHTHNDYLEVASETGLPGAALLFLPILYLFGKMVLSFLDDPRRYRRSITLGCIGSALALLLHGLTDFNFQIPANALIFSVVLGIGYKAACIERREESQMVPPPPYKQ